MSACLKSWSALSARVLGKPPQTAAELVCKGCKLAYPVKDDIPVMLEDEARPLTAEEA
jgi:uncharacterized protein YbaR (Trm112 family)